MTFVDDDTWTVQPDDTQPIPVAAMPLFTDTLAAEPALDGVVVEHPGTRVEVEHDLIPAWAKSLAGVRGEVAWRLRHLRHIILFHGLRAPWYWLKLVGRAPHGSWRIVRPVGAWVWQADERGIVKSHARALKSSIDPDSWDSRRAEADRLAYDDRKKARSKGVKSRLAVVVLGLVLLVFAGFYVADRTNHLAQALIVAVLLAGVGRVPRKPDRPIAMKASQEKTGRISAQVITDALNGLGIAELNKASRHEQALYFPAPVARDGAGWRAVVDLPRGVTAADIIDKRDRLASGLRRPLDCVWPESDPSGHAGRLVLFVSDRPMADAKPAPWPLIKAGRVNLFESFVIGTDQRGKIVEITLMYASMIIGAVPRMGKSFTLRLLLLAAALDVRAWLFVYNLKGSPDHDMLEEVAHRFRAGDDPDDIACLLADVAGVQADMVRRYKTLRTLPRSECPESKVTDELASRPELGLHPVVIAIDECQIAFEHPDHGARITEIVTDLVKRGPAVGIIVLLATQRPDSRSLPTAISSNAVLRFCLRVMSHIENDMVLGTGAYKAGTRATLFNRTDYGVGILAGEGADPQIVRVAYVDGNTAAKIAGRARTARVNGGRLTGLSAGMDPSPDTDSGSILDHLAAVWPEGQGRVWFEVLAEQLAAAYPRYEGWSVDQVSAAVKPHGLTACQINRSVNGVATNRRGLARADLAQALSERDDL
jgi:S-DNA-T family DNA segregation ATPase FtsK/SpoIIIE